MTVNNKILKLLEADPNLEAVCESFNEENSQSMKSGSIYSKNSSQSNGTLINYLNFGAVQKQIMDERDQQNNLEEIKEVGEESVNF